MRREWMWTAALTLGLLATGCATSLDQADLAFAAGDWSRAAASYETALRAPTSPLHADRMLFRLGVAYGLPTSPVFDNERSIARLHTLLTRFPSSPYRSEAALLIDLQEALSTTQAIITAQQAELASLLGARSTVDDRVAVRDEEIAQLQEQLDRTTARLKRVENEMRQLRNIDLQRRP
jgi:hypothetical protein